MAIDDGRKSQKARPQSKFKLGIGGLVGKTIGLWVKNLPSYIVIIGITGVALTILQSFALIGLFGFVGLSLLEFLGTSPIDSVFSLFLTVEPFSVSALLIVFVLSLISLIVYSIVAGAAMKFAITDYENPGTGNIGESFSFAFGRASTLIGTQLLQSLILIGIAVLAMIAVFVDPIISLAVMFLVLYLAARLTPASAIVIVEDHSPITALSRSWQITSGFFLHVFLGQLLVAIVVIIIDLGIGILTGMLLILFLPSLEFSVLMVTIVASILLSPVNYIYLVVLYKDLHARRPTEDINR